MVDIEQQYSAVELGEAGCSCLLLLLVAFGLLVVAIATLVAVAA